MAAAQSVRSFLRSHCASVSRLCVFVCVLSTLRMSGDRRLSLQWVPHLPRMHPQWSLVLVQVLVQVLELPA